MVCMRPARVKFVEKNPVGVNLGFPQNSNPEGYNNPGAFSEGLLFGSSFHLCLRVHRKISWEGCHLLESCLLED